MSNEIKNYLQTLIDAHGADAVRAAVEAVTAQRLPQSFNPLVSEVKLAATLAQLDTAIAEILELGKQQEATYQNKADLQKRSRQLETEIQLQEADAFMQIQGSGKDAFAVVNGNRVSLTNDTARDAYRRHASKDLRKERAEIDGQIASLDTHMAKARDAYNASQEAFNGLRVKATLQAAILAYLT